MLLRVHNPLAIAVGKPRSDGISQVSALYNPRDPISLAWQVPTLRKVAQPVEQLQNRYCACHDEIKRQNIALRDAAFAAKDLRRRIEIESEKLVGVADAGYRAALNETITAYQKQLVFHTDTKRTVFSLKVLYAEVSAILHELEKRGDGDIPVLDNLSL